MRAKAARETSEKTKNSRGSKRCQVITYYFSIQQDRRRYEHSKVAFVSWEILANRKHSMIWKHVFLEPKCLPNCPKSLAYWWVPIMADSAGTPVR